MRLLFFLFLFATTASIGQKINKIGKLPKSIEESSGLILYNDTLFITHNDSGDKPILYFINLKGDLIHQITISNAINDDWEEITKDEQGNIYIGDFGNNLNKRKNLTIYKIAPENLLKTTHVRFVAVDMNLQNICPVLSIGGPSARKLNAAKNAKIKYIENLSIQLHLTDGKLAFVPVVRMLNVRMSNEILK